MRSNAKSYLWLYVGLACTLLLGLLLSKAFAAAPTPLNILSAGGNNSSMIRAAPTYVDVRLLAANTAESQAVPAGARFVLFSSSCSFYAHPTATATVPGSDVTNGSASELNPAAWYLASNITSISVIADATCTITFSFYS